MNLRLMTNNVAEKFRVAVSDGQFLFSPSHSAQLGKEFALPLKGVLESVVATLRNLIE